MNKLLITIQEATQLTGVSRAQLNMWMKSKDFPSMTIGQRGGKTMIHLDAFNEWLRKRFETKTRL